MSFRDNKSNRSGRISFLVVSVLIGICVLFYYHSSTPETKGHSLGAQEHVYNRILRTNTIRCGYTSWKPIFYIDPLTGEPKGIFHDMMEEIGKRLGLKIIWQEEIGWGSIVETIKSGRIDMACAGYWLNPPRIKNLSSTIAQLYTPLLVWTRSSDPIRLHSMDDLNTDRLTVASIDGSAENSTVSKRFPKTKVLALPELNTNADEIESLLDKKVDFIVLDIATTDSYTTSNPGKIKSLFPDQPLVVFPNVMLMPPEEPQLKEMIDDTLHNIEYDGTLDDILKTYHMENSFSRNPRPTNPRIL